MEEIFKNELLAVVKLEEATENDVELYLDISRGLSSKTYSGYENIDEVKNLINNGTVYRIIYGGVIVGFIGFENNEDGSVYLDNLMVSEKYQGEGLGSTALRQCLVMFDKERTFKLVTHPDNTNALNLYKSVGFVEVERKENYFGDGEPRLVMVKNGLTK